MKNSFSGMFNDIFFAVGRKEDGNERKVRLLQVFWPSWSAEVVDDCGDNVNKARHQRIESVEDDCNHIGLARFYGVECLMKVHIAISLQTKECLSLVPSVS